MTEKSLDKEYLPITGLADFTKVMHWRLMLR